MPADIFEEAKRRLDLAHDASDVWPEMPRVFVAELFSGDAEGLAGIAAMDDIHDATPRFAVEGANIVPDRRLIQGFIFHPRHESGRGVCFPFDITNSSISGDGDVEAEVETTGSSTKRESAQASTATVCVNASSGR
jgi:hypothetical protein